MSEATPWSCVEPPATSERRRSNGIRRWRGTLTGCKAPWGTYPAPTYFSGGVQTIGKPSTAGCTNNAIDTTTWANLLSNSPPVDCSLATDPSSCITVYGTPKGSQYPLAVPNLWSGSYNNPEYAVVPIGSSQFENAIARHVDGWNFHDTYFVTFKHTYLTAIGFDFNNYAIASYDSATEHVHVSVRAVVHRAEPNSPA